MKVVAKLFNQFDNWPDALMFLIKSDQIRSHGTHSTRREPGLTNTKVRPNLGQVHLLDEIWPANEKVTNFYERCMHTQKDH